jgi:hypothetical protein
VANASHDVGQDSEVRRKYRFPTPFGGMGMIVPMEKRRMGTTRIGV